MRTWRTWIKSNYGRLTERTTTTFLDTNEGNSTKALQIFLRLPAFYFIVIFGTIFKFDGTAGFQPDFSFVEFWQQPKV